jgi:hypothetical protein
MSARKVHLLCQRSLVSDTIHRLSRDHSQGIAIVVPVVASNFRQVPADAAAGVSLALASGTAVAPVAAESSAGAGVLVFAAPVTGACHGHCGLRGLALPSCWD